jgi:dTDP-4-amino-4,6-dideoxygalactose transaminase
MKVPFFQPYITGHETGYINDIIANHLDMSGDGKYTKLVHTFLETRYHVPKVLLTTSGTTALELAVRLLNLKPGDEIITPSFTFSSTVNAILLASGVKPVFADISARTLNIDPDDIRRKISPRTRAVMAVHYAGNACDMDEIMAITREHHLKVIEDAAQAIDSTYKGKYLGTIGDFGCLSFHDTKNITCGEGGALFINSDDTAIHEQAEIVREKGTNRSKFFRGLVDKYTWVDIGGSYLPSDLLAAFLYAQLQEIDSIINLRREKYAYYYERLQPIAGHSTFSVPVIPDGCQPNAHIFYILLPNAETRNSVLAGLRSRQISASFHYIPLHSSPMGIRLGNHVNALPVTTDISQRILRLPLFSGISKAQQDFVIDALCECLGIRQGYRTGPAVQTGGIGI